MGLDVGFPFHFVSCLTLPLRRETSALSLHSDASHPELSVIMIGQRPNHSTVRRTHMPRSLKQKKSSGGLAEASELSSLNPLRTGMPAMDSILSIKALETSEAAAMAESLEVPRFRIIRTNEVDAYEKAATSMETLDAALAEA